MRKIISSAKSRRAQKISKPRKSRREKKNAKKMAQKIAQEKIAQARKNRARKNPAENPALAGVRPPPPGHGQRGETGYLGYLLRQAQAASRLAMERALADLRVTPPPFAVLTMLNAYPRLSGADRGGVGGPARQTVGVITRTGGRGGSIGKTAPRGQGGVLMWPLPRRGTALLGKCRRLVLAQERRLAAGLTARTRLTVRRWLARLA